MTTTRPTTAPLAPTLDVINCASRFNVAAITPGFGVEILFSRYQDIRIASGHHDLDVFRGVGFSAVLDAVLESRARHDRTFDVLNLATTRRP